MLERRPSGDIELLDQVDQLEPVALACGLDTLSLFRRRHKALTVAISLAGDTHDPERPT